MLGCLDAWPSAYPVQYRHPPTGSFYTPKVFQSGHGAAGAAGGAGEAEGEGQAEGGREREISYEKGSDAQWSNSCRMESDSDWVDSMCVLGSLVGMIVTEVWLPDSVSYVWAWHWCTHCCCLLSAVLDFLLYSVNIFCKRCPA